jgi:hypothetical protein
MRVVKLLRFTVPQSSKKKVRIHQDINIHFKLPKPKKTANSQQVNVSYTTSGSKVSGKVVRKPPAKPSSGYTYTIEW